MHWFITRYIIQIDNVLRHINVVYADTLASSQPPFLAFPFSLPSSHRPNSPPPPTSFPSCSTKLNTTQLQKQNIKIHFKFLSSGSGRRRRRGEGGKTFSSGYIRIKSFCLQVHYGGFLELFQRKLSSQLLRWKSSSGASTIWQRIIFNSVRCKTIL